MNLAQFLFISQACASMQSLYLVDLRTALINEDMYPITQDHRACERITQIMKRTLPAAVAMLGEESELVGEIHQVLETLDAAMSAFK